MDTFGEIDSQVHDAGLVHSLGRLSFAAPEHFIKDVFEATKASLGAVAHAALETSELVKDVLLVEASCAERRLLCGAGLIVDLSFLGI